MQEEDEKKSSIPIPKMIPLDKTQKSDNKDPNRYTIMNGRYRFEHVQRTRPKNKNDERRYRYRGGNVGLVKKVWDLFKPNDKPAFAVKIMHNEDRAENEVKYASLLNRETFWGWRWCEAFSHKYYVFTPWIDGDNLEEFILRLRECVVNDIPINPDQYLTIPERISMFIGYLRQVKKFHDRGLILGDPKISNCMVDYAHRSLELIDLDSVHRKGDGDMSWRCTIGMLPPNLINATKVEKEYSQKDDIFIFGIMLAQMVPEFFVVEVKNNRVERIPPKFNWALGISNNQISEPIRNLFSLCSKMTASNPDDRYDIDMCISTLTEIQQNSKEIKLHKQPTFKTVEQTPQSGSNNSR